jgi:hypothetical protein
MMQHNRTSSLIPDKKNKTLFQKQYRKVKRSSLPRRFEFVAEHHARHHRVHPAFANVEQLQNKQNKQIQKHKNKKKRKEQSFFFFLQQKCCRE